MDSFNPDEVLLGIEKLEQVAKDHKLHLMFLTHAKKKSNEHDPFDDSMGSTSFRGGTDTNIVLRKHGKDRIISTEQRWGSELEPTFLKGWNEEGQSVELGQTVESQAQEQHQTKAKKVVERIEQDILSALDKKSLTQRQLLTEVSGKSVKILEVLSELVVEGNLTNGIELLNTSIWKYGLHNLSDQVLGYQKKLNQIKTFETGTLQAPVYILFNVIRRIGFLEGRPRSCGPLFVPGRDLGCGVEMLGAIGAHGLSQQFLTVSLPVGVRGVEEIAIKIHRGLQRLQRLLIRRA